MVQRRAAKYVTVCNNNRSSVNQMLEHLEWKSLEQRRKDAKKDTLYNYGDDNTLSYGHPDFNVLTCFRIRVKCSY
jgi:hypothetical protein